MEINKEQIKIMYDFLRHKKQTEIRAIKPVWDKSKTERVVSKFVDTSEDFLFEVEQLNGRYNIYVGLNERKSFGKEDEDVKYITNIGHDIDAHSGGEDAKLIAYEIASTIREHCIAEGLNEPLLLDSGRGYWIIHHVKPIENTPENCKKIKAFGLKIKELYEKDGVELDTVVYNPSRIARVAGTLNISQEDNFFISKTLNNPSIDIDEKLTEKILAIEIKEYTSNPILSSSNKEQGICSFMDYCLTHEIPKGERHKVISRNMAIYLATHPQRELLKEQYTKVQGGSEGELDGWLKSIDEKGVDAFPFSIGELVNFTKKYKIPFDWKVTKEYKDYILNKKAEKKLQQEVDKEKKANLNEKAITFFTDKKHLAQQFLQIQPIMFDKAKLWWFWNDDKKCWEVCDETDIMNYISDNSEANTVSSKDRNEILEALRQESRRLMPKAIQPTWIQFKDVIVDISTNERFEATPEYFVTNPLPWALGENKETPNMDRIFEEWVGKDYVKTLYEILAYSMMPDYPINRLFCFIGAGLNGKSKFLDLLHKFIGANNCCTTELDTLLVSRFEITRLHKKLVCMMGETNFNEMSKTSILKKLTGGDLIGFEYKNKNPFDEKNYAKILIATNNLPTTTDKTVGFYRRWMIIDFPNKFSEKKDILAEIPDEEYEALALKCCDILKELLIKREFHKEGTIEQRTERYEAKSNFIQTFLKETTDEDVNGYITSADFFKKFQAWSRENKHREMSETSVGITMKKIGIEQERKYFNWLYEGKGGQLKCWVGIKWKD